MIPSSSFVNPTHLAHSDTPRGKPRPAVTWWRDYALLDDTYTFVTGDNSVRNELEIEELRRNDLLAVLQCQASNNNITVPASVSITLDVNRTVPGTTTEWRAHYNWQLHRRSAHRLVRLNTSSSYYLGKRITIDVQSHLPQNCPRTLPERKEFHAVLLSVLPDDFWS
ncbi:ig-like domain-containing protein [Trichonephila clavipes]|nr:ig-like domain-containing protein [Trichonephila clavipes]